jgi:hypothetical protein
MLPLATNSNIDLSQSALQPRRRRYKPRRKGTSRAKTQLWTNEQLNLLSYLRHRRHLPFIQIKEKYFPSRSLGAVYGAYWRLSTEDRIHRASIITSGSASLRNAAGDRQTWHEPSPCSPGPVSGSESVTEDDAKISISCLPTLESESVVVTHCDTGRYNLRPNRPTVFLPREPQYLVDCLRFPRFSQSYKYHLESAGLLDEDYCPPSHTPTPEASDCSPSVISTQLSEVSSLDLFGLEPRSPRLSNRESSPISSSPIDLPSPEFFSAEEHLSSP